MRMVYGQSLQQNAALTMVLEMILFQEQEFQINALIVPFEFP